MAALNVENDVETKGVNKPIVYEKSLDSVVTGSKNNTERYQGVLDDVVLSAKKNKVDISKQKKKELVSRKKVANKYFKGKDSKDISPLWKALSSVNAQHKEMNQKQLRYEGVTTFILVSLSMPKSSLEELFTEIAYQHEDEGIVFVFQGWPASHFNEFIRKIHALFPEGKSPVVAIDPTVFKRLNVDKVPFFAIDTKEKGWKKVLGDVTYARAVEEAYSHYEIFRPIGKIFPISEPNMLDYIYKKIQETDWDKQIKQATNNLVEKKKAVVDLPYAGNSYRYMVDGSVKFKKDVEVNGQLLVHEGDVVNPFSVMGLSSRYAIVDLSDPNQVEILRYWRNKYSNIKLISTTLPSFKNKYDLESEFGVIHQLDPLLAKRFALEKIPSLVYQDGSRLAVEVIQHDIKLSELKIKGESND